ncbi:MAG: enoyl-CoA hydratase/isomerase family protein [Xanthomonadales bacterium]|nr:enoyl-CoA hydratase/isomerase family protein [Xanthomonadales bacterium]
MQYQLIRYSTEGPLAWLSLNRPDKLNAISPAMIAELNHALDRAESDPEVRVILLTGEGRAFSAGFDLDMGMEEQAGAREDHEERKSAMRRELTQDFNIIMRFWDCPKPTIAAVHTYCLGSAMEMAVACDITIAASDCRFGAPEVKFGSGIVALLLPWFCGPKKAKELLLTGTDRLSAEQAQACGLVNQVVAGDALLASARAMAMEIAGNDQLAVRLTKQAINRSMETAGMRRALLDALETDIEIESTDTPETRQFNDIMKSHGAKAAIAWRRAQVG